MKNPAMTKVDFLAFMEEYAPAYLAESWDNVGMLLDMGAVSYRKVLIALDLRQEVIDFAISEKVNLIITHHPIFFQPTRSLSVFEMDQMWLMMLIRYNISLFSAHTNLDVCEKGVNAQLANALQLENQFVLDPHDDNSQQGFIRMGTLPNELSEDDFIHWVKEALHTSAVRIAGKHYGPIKTVAVSSGAGFDGARVARLAEADAFVSSEIKHHMAVMANQQGVLLVDAGHYETEHLIVESLKSELQKTFNDQDYNTTFLSCDGETPLITTR